MDLKTLTDAFGPSGLENEVRKLLMEAARPLADAVYLDKLGNVIAVKKAKTPGLPRVLVSGHMDEVGFIVTGHTDEGLLRFTCVGGIESKVVVSKWVKIGPDRLPGVIGAVAIHLQSREDLEKVLGYSKLFIDIGAKDQKEAQQRCPVGSYACFDTPYAEFGEGFVCAKALDDRVGCLNALEALKSDYPGETLAVFVSQEEVGLRGAQAAGYALNPDLVINLEGTAANDLGDVKEKDRVCTPGLGVAVSFMDNASIGDRELFNKMLTVAEIENIPCQVKQAVTGGNDAGAYQRALGGCKTVVLSVPCRYIHSGASVAKLSDIKAQGELVRAFLNSL